MNKFFILFLFIFTPLFAQEKWYVKGGIGINYLNPPSQDILELEMDTGFYSNATIGYQFNEHLHSEIEGAYRCNEGYAASMDGMHNDLKGKVSSYAGMINLLLDFPFQDIFILSLGGGTGIHKTIGELNTTFEGTNLTYVQIVNLRKEGMAVQGICGMHVHLSPRFCLGGEFKFWKAVDSIQCNTVSFNLKLAF